MDKERKIWQFSNQSIQQQHQIAWWLMHNKHHFGGPQEKEKNEVRTHCEHANCVREKSHHKRFRHSTQKIKNLENWFLTTGRRRCHQYKQKNHESRILKQHIFMVDKSSQWNEPAQNEEREREKNDE